MRCPSGEGVTVPSVGSQGRQQAHGPRGRGAGTALGGPGFSGRQGPPGRQGGAPGAGVKQREAGAGVLKGDSGGRRRDRREMQTWARKDQWAGSAPTVATGRRGHTGGPAQCSATCAVKAEKSGPQGALSRKGDLPRRLHLHPTTARAGARRALLRPMLGTEVTRAPPRRGQPGTSWQTCPRSRLRAPPFHRSALDRNPAPRWLQAASPQH